MIFKTNPTDRGMCCTFNALAAEKIYRETKFSTSVASLQKQNVLDSFEYPSPLPPGRINVLVPTRIAEVNFRAKYLILLL